MMTNRDMRVLQVEFDFGDLDKPISDWRLSLEYATFTHKEACEFIFFVGSEEKDTHEFLMRDYEAKGFSQEFLAECRKAWNWGYKYICLYA
jgi:hypothetical protein